jgi:hypothetical protein
MSSARRGAGPARTAALGRRERLGKSPPEVLAARRLGTRERLHSEDSGDTLSGASEREVAVSEGLGRLPRVRLDHVPLALRTYPS